MISRRHRVPETRSMTCIHSRSTAARSRSLRLWSRFQTLGSVGIRTRRCWSVESSKSSKAPLRTAYSAAADQLCWARRSRVSVCSLASTNTPGAGFSCRIEATGAFARAGSPSGQVHIEMSAQVTPVGFSAEQQAVRLLQVRVHASPGAASPLEVISQAGRGLHVDDPLQPLQVHAHPERRGGHHGLKLPRGEPITHSALVSWRGPRGRARPRSPARPDAEPG